MQPANAYLSRKTSVRDPRHVRKETFPVPGSDQVLIYERNEAGRLLRLTAENGRVYYSDNGFERIFDGGFARFSEAPVPQGFLRKAHTTGKTWVEEYLWDADGRLSRVDGVSIKRDSRKRVFECSGPSGKWRYTYEGEMLTAIDGPHGRRDIRYESSGRPEAIREGDDWKPLSKRSYNRLPANQHTDKLGRLWTVTHGDGRTQFTYLWDGCACLGRIDGPVGEPLKMVFSLDPSNTPVRVVTADGVQRVPRDAFGEGLLQLEGVPGLFGGTIHAGEVVYQARAMDPMTGAFTTPDPWHGYHDDPRRREGYTGPLAVERSSGGPYMVCQGDPVGRADFTGTNSILLVLSDLTWSWQNNITSIFGLDLWFNLLTSLFGSISGTNFIGRFFNFGGFSSTDRQGAFGIRRDGAVKAMIPNPAFTFQHLVFVDDTELELLQRVRVFAPDPLGDFVPAYYGTFLRLAPDSGPVLLLRGDRRIGQLNNPNGLATWSRSGGPARPAIPGSMVPVFPTGGLHLDITSTVLHTPLAGELQELEPDGDVLLSTLDQQDTIVLPGIVSGFSAGGFALVTDPAGLTVIVQIDSVTELTNTSLVVRSAIPTAFASTGLRVRGLGASSPAEENLLLVPGQPDRLNLVSIAAGSAPYTKTDALRLSQAGVEIGAAIVQEFEARLQIDGGLPGGPTGLVSTLKIHVADVGAPGSPRPTVISDTQLEFPIDPPPVGGGEAILVGSAPNQKAVVITAVAGGQVTLDRGIGAAGTVGATIAWRRLARGARLGERRADPEAASQVTYIPDQIRRAPTTDLIWIEDSSTPVRLAVRSVSARDYDGLVLGAPAPGNTGSGYTVERFPIQAPDATGASSGRTTVIRLPSPLSDRAIALQSTHLSTPTLSAGTATGTTGTVAGNILSTIEPVFSTPTPATTPRPFPSESVVLGQTGTTSLAAALVQQVKVTVTFERPLALSTHDQLKAAILKDSSPSYAAQRNAPQEVTVLPQVGGNRVQMPRFEAGQMVRLQWTPTLVPPERNTRQARLTKVEGTTLTLEGDNDLPATTPDLTVTRLDIDDPGTGGIFMAIGGTHNAATPNQVTFQVWDRAAFSSNRMVAIVDGDRSLPVRVVASGAGVNQSVQVVFASNPSLTGANVVINALPLVAGTNPEFIGEFTLSADRRTITATTSATALAAPGGEALAAIVPYRQKGNAARGSFGSGTTLIPDDPEHYELDRMNALEEHELRHTMQCAYAGPWLLSWFPLFGLEGILEAATNIELPEYSAYAQAHVERRNNSMLLVIENPPAGVQFATGNRVQITRAGQITSVALGTSSEANQFQIPATLELPDCPEGETCPVFVRKDNHDGWRTFYDTFYFTTTGGLLNTAFGFTYGDGISGLGKLFYALGNVITSPGKKYRAAVQGEGQELRLTSAEGRTPLRDATRLMILSGDQVLVRVKESMADDVIRLSSRIELTGEVDVAPYDTHTPDSYFDWNDYYPATVPDPNRPTTIKLESVGGSHLTLEPFDVVTVTARSTSRDTTVISVRGDEVDLEEIPPTDTDHSLRVAKISEQDPLGGIDTFQFRRLGLNWLRYLFDPYRQFQYALDPTSGSFWDILARIGRYMFSSKSWSFIPPFFGLWEWDNVFKQGAPHFSWMEQDASSASGDLYSSLGRLRGEVAVVGDIARYWFFISGRNGGLITTDRQDSPINHYNDFPRIIPSLDTTGAGTTEPNRTAQVNPAVADPGLDVPDLFYQKNLATPNAAVAAGPAGFQPGGRGYIPTSQNLQDAMGMYVAFSRPGPHRATLANNNALRDSREAQTEGMSILGISFGNQPLYFDITVQDVTVTVAGQDVVTPAAGTALPRVPLVLAQRATITVSPNATRRYMVTVTNPVNGTVLRAPADLELQAGLQIGNDQPVEISRVHRFRDGAFEGSGLQQHGLHLPGDVHIPVRLFVIDVVDTLPVRSAASLDPANILAEARAGTQAFVIVPASVLAPLNLAQVTHHGTAIPGITNPAPGISLLSPIPEDLRAFTGDGAIFQIDFPANDPPEENAALEFRVQVGSGASNATLEATINYLPHFQLILPGGGTNYQVARSSQLALELTGGIAPGTVSISPEDGASVTVQGSQVIVAASGTAVLGPRQVRVSNADPAHADQIARRTVTVI